MIGHAVTAVLAVTAYGLATRLRATNLELEATRRDLATMSDRYDMLTRVRPAWTTRTTTQETER